jgi:hypothetical protein
MTVVITGNRSALVGATGKIVLPKDAQVTDSIDFGRPLAQTLRYR